MKRIFVSIFFAATVWMSTQAQLFSILGHDVGFIYLGPKIGTNISRFSQWSYSQYDVKSRFGYQLGVVGEFGFTKKFSIQSELTFISKGTKGEIPELNITETKRMPAIQIPLLARYTFSLLGLEKVHANGGFYSTTRLAKGKEIYEDNAVYEDYHWTRFDWGLSLGAGAEYPTEKGIWGLDFRYDLGFVDVYRQMDESTKSRFRSFQISVTYKIDWIDFYNQIRKKKNQPNDTNKPDKS